MNSASFAWKNELGEVVEMPLYAYECSAAHVTRGFYASDSIPKTVRCEACKRRARRIFACMVAPAGNFPMTSSAAGVAVSQIEEATQLSREPGMVPVEFDKEGDAIFMSRKHRKDYCESVGLHDKDGGIGDPMPVGN